MKLFLEPSTLIKRYKRFLADVSIPQKDTSSHVFTIHCANTGAMTGCANAGDTVWFSTSDNLKRKYPNSWELTHTASNHWICVNTIRANQLAEEAITSNLISAFKGHSHLRREVKYGDEKSKIDFHLIDAQQRETFIEVKSVTLLESGQGYFPDTVTVRGQKHLRELMSVVANGHRGVLLFAVLHSGIDSVKPAMHIDPTYAALLKEAFDCGVEVMAYKADFTIDGGDIEMQLLTPLAVNLTND